MKKVSKQRLLEVMSRLDSTFKPKLNENRTHDYVRSAKTLEELTDMVRELRLSKGDLMQIAYDGNTRNVDSALPAGIWDALEPYGGTYWFVMDYTDNTVGGELVHLGEKILGIQTNWNEKIRDSMSDMNENFNDSENNLNENQTLLDMFNKVTTRSEEHRMVDMMFNYLGQIKEVLSDGLDDGRPTTEYYKRVDELKKDVITRIDKIIDDIGDIYAISDY